jgi:hypothetical protein
MQIELYKLFSQSSKLRTSSMTEASKIGIGPLKSLMYMPDGPIHISSWDYNSVKKSSRE